MSEFEEGLATAIAITVKEYVAPLLKRIEQLEAENIDLRAQLKFLKETGVNFRGPFEDGKTYMVGDAVQRGGNVWRARASTSDKPPAEAWQLVIRKGRDGKDGRNA